MSDVMTNEARSAETRLVQGERRRPGRIANASPELIALMRNPASRAARAHVALYDAPGFVPPAVTQAARPRHFLKIAVAVVASSAVWAAAFKAMMVVWG